MKSSILVGGFSDSQGHCINVSHVDVSTSVSLYMHNKINVYMLYDLRASNVN